MKTSIKIFALGIVLAGFGLNANAQQGTTATANASGTIVTPIAVTKNVDLAFGNVAVNTSDGTVTVPATLAATRLFDGGVTLPAVTGTVTAAKFTVTGVTAAAYSFTTSPASITVTSGANTMTVNNFTNNSTNVITGGSIVVYVGAKLIVTGSQAPGLYESTVPFTVTVDYN